MQVVAAVAGFRGTATAAEVAAAVGHACWERGHDCREIPVTDGADGLLDVLGGANRTSVVTGPLGARVAVPWRLSGGTAVIETALVHGLGVAGGAAANDPLGATTAGTGELIDQAVAAGADRIIVGLGGSATTDGGLGALQALGSPHRVRGVELLVACDVPTRFTDAAREFAPLKGASPAQVAMLTRRLEQLADRYRSEFGVDVSSIEGSGAAGGLAGALAAIGGRLVDGFDLVADELDVADAIEEADLVITGEGHLDAHRLSGGVVGRVAGLAAHAGAPVAMIAVTIDPEIAGRVEARSIAEMFGDERARREPLWCVERAVADLLTTRR